MSHPPKTPADSLPDGSDGPAVVMPTIASAGYRTYVLLILTLVMVCNYADRAVIGVVLEPIKHEFGLADWQLGLLGGLAFATLYSIAGFPLARLAERRSRVNIISASMAVWSAMTAVCGMVTCPLPDPSV